MKTISSAFNCPCSGDFPRKNGTYPDTTVADQTGVILRVYALKSADNYQLSCCCTVPPLSQRVLHSFLLFRATNHLPFRTDQELTVVKQLSRETSRFQRYIHNYIIDSLYCRRLKFHLIMCYKISNNQIHIDSSRYFTAPAYSETRRKFHVY